MKYYGIQFLESIGSRELAGVHGQNDNFVEGFAWRVAGWGLGPLGGDGCIGKFARLLGWLGPLWGAGWRSGFVKSTGSEGSVVWGPVAGQGWLAGWQARQGAGPTRDLAGWQGLWLEVGCSG